MNYDDNKPLDEQDQIVAEADTASGFEFDPKPKFEVHEGGHGHHEGHDDVHFGAGHAGGGHGAGGSHGTEMGWLVSYADMMTLLFGLFVLLYTMSSTTSKGQMEEQMKKISEEAFGGAISAVELEKASPDEMIEKLLDKNKQMAKDLQKSQEEIEKKKDLTVTETEKKQLEVKIAELEKRMQEQQTIEKQQSAKVEEQKRQIASVQEQNTVIQSVTLENKKIKEELEKTQKKQKELVEKMKDMVPKEDKKVVENPNNFLMISTTWATEKHDIDLEIVDTNNKKFNFKKKSYGGIDGQFEIDSRYGPGLEMWKTPKLQPGQYKVKVTLYNSNGNDAPAEVQTSLITVTENVKLPRITLSKTDKVKEVRFSVDEKGKITLE